MNATVKVPVHTLPLVNSFRKYSRNFYAKDADELFISLPTKNKQPDFAFIETYIIVTQKLVIKDVVYWKDKIIATTQCIIK